MRPWPAQLGTEHLAPFASVRQAIQLCLHGRDALELDVERGAEARHLQGLLMNARRQLVEHRC
jgi:hypothetical protein